MSNSKKKVIVRRNEHMSERLGFNEYEVGVLKECGFTPETARDHVVAKLRKFNLAEEHLKCFADINKLDYTGRTVILDMIIRRNYEPEHWVEVTGKDFSDPYYFGLFTNYMDS